MSSKFLNISTDNTLGGNSPSNEVVSSQKAIKEYIDNNTEVPLQVVTFYLSNGNYVCTTPISAIMQKLALGWEIRGQYVDMNANPIEGYEFCCTYGKGDFNNTNTVGNTVTFTADLGDSVAILTGLITSGPADTWTWEQLPQEKIKVINLTITETQVGMTVTSDTGVQDIHNYVADGYLVFANASITGQTTKAMLPLIIDMTNNGVYVVGFKLFMLNEGVLVIGYSDGVNADVWQLDYNAEVYKCVFTNNNGAYSCSMEISDIIDKAVEDHMYIFGVEQDANDTYLKYYTFVGANGDLSDDEAVNNYVEFSYTNGTTIEILKGTITANGDTWVKTATTLSDEKLAVSEVTDGPGNYQQDQHYLLMTDADDNTITSAKTREYSDLVSIKRDQGDMSDYGVNLTIGNGDSTCNPSLEFYKPADGMSTIISPVWIEDNGSNSDAILELPGVSGTLALTTDFSGTDDGTNWTSLTINGTTKAIPSGGGGGGGDLPSQTGHSGEYLTTNGSTASWAPIITVKTFTVTA